MTESSGRTGGCFRNESTNERAKFNLRPFRSSLNTVKVQPTLLHSSVFHSSNPNNGLYHRKHSKDLFALNSRLMVMKQDYSILTYFHTVAKITFLLRSTQRKLVFLTLRTNDILDTIKLEVEQCTQSSITVDIMREIEDGLKECKLLIEQLHHSLACLKKNYKCRTHEKLQEYILHMQSLYQSISNHFRSFVKTVHSAMSFLHNRSSITKLSFNQIIRNCYALFQMLHKVSNEMKSISIKNQKSYSLKYDCNIDSSQGISEYLMQTMKESAKWRSLVISRSVYQIITKELFELKVSFSVKKRDEGLRKCLESLQNHSSQFVSDEESFFNSIWEQIISEEENETHSSFKIDCFIKSYGMEENSVSLQDSRLILDLYVKSLWRTIKSNLKTFFVDFYFGTSVGISLWDVLLPVSASNYAHLVEDGGQCPVSFLEVLSSVFFTSSCICFLQKWDYGMCRAMSSALKEKFRFSSKNRTSSDTIGLLTRNQIKQLDLLDSLKVMLPMVNHSVTAFECCNPNLYNLIYITSNIFIKYINSFFKLKRQQFLHTACYGQFFVVGYIDVHIATDVIDKVIDKTNKIFSEHSEALHLIVEHLVSDCSLMKRYEECTTGLFLNSIKVRSRKCFKDQMPIGKVWRRKGYNVQQDEANPYVNLCINAIFPSVFGSIDCLTPDIALDTLKNCVDRFVRAWMEFILENQIMFSWCGANQLKIDFDYFLSWLDQNNSAYSADYLPELKFTASVKEMENAILLLSCQPQKKKDFGSLNKRVSTSTVSEESLDTFTGNQFDDIILRVEMKEKVKWLSLRTKTSQTSRFFCLS